MPSSPQWILIEGYDLLRLEKCNHPGSNHSPLTMFPRYLSVLTCRHAQQVPRHALSRTRIPPALKNPALLDAGPPAVSIADALTLWSPVYGRRSHSAHAYIYRDIYRRCIVDPPFDLDRGRYRSRAFGQRTPRILLLLRALAATKTCSKMPYIEMKTDSCVGG